MIPKNRASLVVLFLPQNLEYPTALENRASLVVSYPDEVDRTVGAHRDREL
jgi:hypothetical protein